MHGMVRFQCCTTARARAHTHTHDLLPSFLFPLSAPSQTPQDDVVRGSCRENARHIILLSQVVSFTLSDYMQKQCVCMDEVWYLPCLNLFVPRSNEREEDFS